MPKVEHLKNMREALLEQDKLSQELRKEETREEEMKRIRTERSLWSLNHGGITHPDDRTNPF